MSLSPRVGYVGSPRILRAGRGGVNRTVFMQDETPRLLLIETSAQIGRVGLACGADLLAERALDETRRHARDLAPSVAALLADHGRQPRDVTAVVVSLGPGSYTGLRVGIMSAKAFAYATGCAVIGVPTLDVIARQADGAGPALEVIADAQKEKLYLQPFSRRSGVGPYVPAGPLVVVTGPKWARDRNPKTPVTGPGLRVAQSWLPGETLILSVGRWEPSLGALLDVGVERLRGDDRDDPLRLEPIYLRPSSAEEQWDRRS
jgi:tRNA threonylcarbamoyladenosine biosynthesis protein TsaB